MHVLLTLFLTLWTAVSPNLQVHRVDGPVEFTDLYGSAREAEAALGWAVTRKHRTCGCHQR